LQLCARPAMYVFSDCC